MILLTKMLVECAKSKVNVLETKKLAEMQLKGFQTVKKQHKDNN